MKWYRMTALVLLAAAACAALAADVATPPFFDALLEEGAWFKLGDTSWAWQPAVMQQNPDWRPYLDGGSWTRHEENWFWASEYAWGAIAFHHGRWLETAEYGWLWVPGTQWCPAWVDWQLTPTHSGWAPLPPDKAFLGSIGVTNHLPGWQQYAFVSNGDFLARELRPRLVAAAQFANETVISFTGPAPDQVGYVAPEGPGSVASVIVQEREDPAINDEVHTTVYLREPVLAYSPCRVNVDYGDSFHLRHPPACRPPVRVRRTDRGRQADSPPPPPRPPAPKPPAVPRPAKKPPVVQPPPPQRPPSTVVPLPAKKPPAVQPPSPPMRRPPSAMVPRPAKKPPAVQPPSPPMRRPPSAVVPRAAKKPPVVPPPMSRSAPPKRK